MLGNAAQLRVLRRVRRSLGVLRFCGFDGLDRNTRPRQTLALKKMVPSFARETFVVADDGSRLSVFAFVIRVFLPKIWTATPVQHYQTSRQLQELPIAVPVHRSRFKNHRCQPMLQIAFREATHVTTRLPLGSGKQRDSRSDFENEEIDGTWIKGRLFRLTHGQSVQRFKDACSDPKRVVSAAKPGIHQQERSLMSNAQQW